MPADQPCWPEPLRCEGGCLCRLRWRHDSPVESCGVAVPVGHIHLHRRALTNVLCYQLIGVLALFSSIVVELAVFLIAERSHLLELHLLGMGDLPLSHSPLQSLEATIIETRLSSLQSLHSLLACEHGIGHDPRQHQVPAAQRWIHKCVVGAGGYLRTTPLGCFALLPLQLQTAQESCQLLSAVRGFHHYGMCMLLIHKGLLVASDCLH